VPARGVIADHDLHSLVSCCADKPVGVVARIGDQRSALGVSEKLLDSSHFMALPSSQRDVERPRLDVDERVELGRKTSSRASQSVVFDPPLPPEAS